MSRVREVVLREGERQKEEDGAKTEAVSTGQNLKDKHTQQTIPNYSADRKMNTMM